MKNTKIKNKQNKNSEAKYRLSKTKKMVCF